MISRSCFARIYSQKISRSYGKYVYNSDMFEKKCVGILKKYKNYSEYKKSISQCRADYKSQQAKRYRYTNSDWDRQCTICHRSKFFKWMFSISLNIHDIVEDIIGGRQKTVCEKAP